MLLMYLGGLSAAEALATARRHRPIISPSGGLADLLVRLDRIWRTGPAALDPSAAPGPTGTLPSSSHPPPRRLGGYGPWPGGFLRCYLGDWHCPSCGLLRRAATPGCICGGRKEEGRPALVLSRDQFHSLVLAVRDTCRRSRDAALRWQGWCAHYAANNMDPASHGGIHLLDFLRVAGPYVPEAALRAEADALAHWAL